MGQSQSTTSEKSCVKVEISSKAHVLLDVGFATKTQKHDSDDLQHYDGWTACRNPASLLVLRNWDQFLKGAGECVPEAPHGSRLELIVDRLEIQVMHPSSQVLREALLTLDECLVDQEFGRSIGQLPRLPFFDLPLQRPEVSVHPVNSDLKAVFQQEILGMFGQHWHVVPVECEIFANEHSQPHSTTQPE